MEIAIANVATSVRNSYHNSSGKKKCLRFAFVERSLHDTLFTVLCNVAYTRIIIVITKNVHTSGRKYD